MAQQSSGTGYRDRNSTADRALTILEMFSDTKLTISAMEVAKELAVARSTAYRYLESLVSRGFLEESPTGGFRLGLNILRLARVARAGYGLSEVALPYMRELTKKFQQTVVLTRRAGTTVVCLERELPAGQLMQISYERGSQLPLTAGASALVLLAWLKDPEARQLLETTERPQFTDKTLTNIDDLMARLAAIRHDGYSVSHGEVDPDALGIATPIFDATNEITAGLSIIGFGSRIQRQTRQQMIDDLISASENISNVLALAGTS